MARSDHPQLLLPPPAYPVAILAAAWGLDLFFDWSWLPDAIAVRIFGAALLSAGIGFALWAVISFIHAGTHVEPHKPTLSLVTTGPYCWSRNPIHLSFLLMFLGVALSVRLEWGILLLPVLWACLRYLVIAPEEAFLTTRFGATYSMFCARTARWIRFTPPLPLS